MSIKIKIFVIAAQMESVCTKAWCTLRVRGGKTAVTTNVFVKMLEKASTAATTSESCCC